MTKRYVIIGAGHAGRRMAESLRELDENAIIIMVGEEVEIPYDRPALSKEGLVDEQGIQDSFVQNLAFYQDNRIELVLGAQASNIDAEKKIITLNNNDKLTYDQLILTTGSRVRTLDIPGAEQAEIYYLRTIVDSRKLREKAQCRKKVTIVGGGFIGLEVAATLTSHFDCEVTLLEAGSRILKRVMPKELSDYMHQLHTKKGVTIELNSCVHSIEKHGEDQYTLHTSNGTIESELIIVGIGVHPNQELAANAGIEVNNGILVDSKGRTNLKDIYAAGDVTAHFNPFYQAHIRLESWQVAENQPQAIAQHIYGDIEAEFTDLPWLWSDQYDHNLQMLGDFCFAAQIIMRQEEGKPQNFAILGLNEENQLKAVCAVNQGRDMTMYRRLMQKECAIPIVQITDSATPLRSLQHLLRS